MSSLIIDAEVHFHCEGQFVPGSYDKYDCFHGNWIPGDQPEIKNFRVYVKKDGDKLDVTRFLPKDTIEELKDKFILEMEEGIEDIEFETDNAS